MNSTRASTFVVIGGGSIGRRHYENLRDGTESRVLVKSRATSSLPEWLPERDRITSFDDCGLDELAGAIVATPAPFHHLDAVPLIDAGVPVLIEKPLADSPARADQIVDAVKRTKTPAMVGYVLRWYKPLQQMVSMVRNGAIGRPIHLSASVGSHLATWRPSIDYRASVSANHSLGGGALLELSHEIDYCMWLLGRPQSVSAAIGQSGVLEADVEDLADIQLRFASGAAASIHLDLVDWGSHRRCRIVGTDGTLELDLLTHKLTMLEVSGRRQEHHATIDPNDMFLRQQERFLAMADGDTPASDALATARDVVDVIALARQAAETGVRTAL